MGWGWGWGFTSGQKYKETKLKSIQVLCTPTKTFQTFNSSKNNNTQTPKNKDNPHLCFIFEESGSKNHSLAPYTSRKKCSLAPYTYASLRNPVEILQFGTIHLWMWGWGSIQWTSAMHTYNNAEMFNNTLEKTHHPKTKKIQTSLKSLRKLG